MVLVITNQSARRHATTCVGVMRELLRWCAFVPCLVFPGHLHVEDQVEDVEATCAGREPLQEVGWCVNNMAAGKWVALVQHLGNCGWWK